MSTRPSPHAHASMSARWSIAVRQTGRRRRAMQAKITTRGIASENQDNAHQTPPCPNSAANSPNAINSESATGHRQI
jgi:hypothetical protein